MKTLTLLLTLALYLASPPVLATGDYFEYFYRDFDIGNADVAAEFQQVLRAVDQKNYSDASQLMSALVGKLDAAPNLDPGAHAQLLADAGILKASVFDNKAALDLLDKSDKMVVRYVGVYSPMLFNMLMAQGMVHSNVKDYPAAIESFRRAQHIVHRQDGVFSPKQIGVIDKIARVDQEQGSWLDSDRQERFDLLISERSYGADSEALVPILERLGQYFAGRGDSLPPFVPDPSLETDALKARTGSQDITVFRASIFQESFAMFNRAIKILEDKYGANDPRLVEPLKELSNALLLQHTRNSQSERAMERALHIVEQDPNTDVADHALTLVQLGDIYSITQDPRAGERYTEAWNLLAKHKELNGLQRHLFNTPTRLYPTARSLVVNQRPMGTQPGEPLYADIQFNVDSDGIPRHVKVIDGNIGYADKTSIARIFRHELRFRPRLVNGKPVMTRGLVYHQTFVTLAPPAPPPALDASVGASAP